MLVSKIFQTLVLIAAVNPVFSQPIVTLSHGGKLRGRKVEFGDISVDAYLGVRYAAAPVGSLRFRKPQPEQRWRGVKNATKMGNVCPQLEYFNVENPGSIAGNEDCLFLDVWVPSNFSNQERKAVMVWIHGGGYVFGTGQQIMAPLVKTGDVIVVSINYRIGPFGFLTDGFKHSGNFGLWDQRQALIWIQQNIARFGGDPSQVTIFGESAGGASVSCQSVGQRNNNLFQRVIQQSGSCFSVWAFGPTTVLDYRIQANELRTKLKCAKNNFYGCFSQLSTQEVMQIFLESGALAMNSKYALIPHMDEDFFSIEVADEQYEGMNRFDYMLGYNGQEGASLIPFITVNNLLGSNFSIENGLTFQQARTVIATLICEKYLAEAKELCVDYLINLYKINESLNNREITLRSSFLFGDIEYAMDSVHQLVQAQKLSGDKNLYGYTFTELYYPVPEADLFQIPPWLKVSATHTDELPLLFGCTDLKPNYTQLAQDIYKDAIGEKFATLEDIYVKNCKDSFKPLSENMRKMWSNFAKTGNPNQPMKISGPVWTEYNSNNDKIMELNSNPQLIDVVDKNRLENLYRTIKTTFKSLHKTARTLLPTDYAGHYRTRWMCE